jgi:lipid-binding SYLF domain-containing protein
MKKISLTAIVLAFCACATAPKTAGDKRSLEDEASNTLATMIQKDPGLDARLRSSAGYAVFPSIGKGGFIAGAAYGRGILYERGRPVGFVELNQGSIGAQIGAQTFAELIVFMDPNKVSELKTGEFSLGANVSGVVLTTGAAATAQFDGGIGVFVMPKGGAMAELSVSGQQINFQPGAG